MTPSIKGFSLNSTGDLVCPVCESLDTTISITLTTVVTCTLNNETLSCVNTDLSESIATFRASLDLAHNPSDTTHRLFCHSCKNEVHVHRDYLLDLLPNVSPAHETRTRIHGFGTTLRIWHNLLPDKKMCVACEDNFYNDNNPYGVKECWSFANTKVVDKQGPASLQSCGPKIIMHQTLACWHSVINRGY